MKKNKPHVQGYLVEGVYVDANGTPIERPEQTETEENEADEVDETQALVTDTGAAKYLNELQTSLTPLLSTLGLDIETEPGILINHLSETLSQKETESANLRTDFAKSLERASADRGNLETQVTSLTTERDGLKASIADLEKTVADLKKAAKDAKDAKDKGAPAPAAPAAATPAA